jgi:hypothetical protein
MFLCVMTVSRKTKFFMFFSSLLLLVECFFLCIFLVSCTESKNITVENFDDLTLRAEAYEKQRKTVWSDELEKNILEKKTDANPSVAEGIELQPGVMIVMEHGEQDSIYPSINGFCSLDIRELEEAQQKVINGFCNAIASNSDADSFMVSGSISSLVIFLADLHSFFPDKRTDTPLFSSWLPGKPFINDILFQVPVRFIHADGILDILLYLNKNQNWKIDQIQVRNMQVK